MDFADTCTSTAEGYGFESFFQMCSDNDQAQFFQKHQSVCQGRLVDITRKFNTWAKNMKNKEILREREARKLFY